MIVDIVTLFPGMFHGPLHESILKRAAQKKKMTVRLHDLRFYTHDRHKTVDDVPYGGGPGMVLKPEPVFEAVQDICRRRKVKKILLTPQGGPLTQDRVQNLSQEKNIFLLCGHYEGFDERIRDGIDFEEISIGDYVLTGGELPAMVLLDAMVRLIPGVLGDEASLDHESFARCCLDFPQYTRPRRYKGMTVPDILLSGHHREIAHWRAKESLRRTWRRRPDLLAHAALSASQRELLNTIKREEKR